MRHFKTKKEAFKFRESIYRNDPTIKVFKKLKGHRNRIKKPFVVGSEFEWLNLD